MGEKALLKILAAILSMLCMVGITESREKDTNSYRSDRPHIDISRLEKKIHALVNEERKKKGLLVLSWDEGLHEVARKYSQDMGRRHFFSHIDPEGRCFYDRYKAAGVECNIRIGDAICLGAENISQDNLYSSSLYQHGETLFDWTTEDGIAESVVNRWMRSIGHRKNILTPYFKREGLGVSLGDGKVYVTENFC
ncbi:MAG: CAP domain-containing protein [Thermodesulfovibrionales bacterium]